MNSVQKMIAALGMGAVSMVLLGSNAHAGPVSYEGSLSSGVTEYSQVSEPNQDSINNDFWSFFGNAGDIVDLVVHRREATLDPGFFLYFGTGSDTESLMLSYLLFGDDDVPPLPGYAGPHLDPALFSYVLPYTGDYTVEVLSVESGDAGQDGVYDYQITLNGVTNPAQVPEPGVLALFGVGLAGMALAARRKRR